MTAWWIPTFLFATHLFFQVKFWVEVHQIQAEVPWLKGVGVRCSAGTLPQSTHRQPWPVWAQLAEWHTFIPFQVAEYLKQSLKLPRVPWQTFQNYTDWAPSPHRNPPGTAIAGDYAVFHSPELLSAFLNLTQSRAFSSPASLQKASWNTVPPDPASPQFPSPSPALTSWGPYYRIDEHPW